MSSKEEEVSKRISASSASQPSVALPEIKCVRKRLEEIIKYVPLSDGHKNETAEFLDAIDKQVALLREYQTEEQLNDFYPQMQASVEASVNSVINERQKNKEMRWTRWCPRHITNQNLYF